MENFSALRAISGFLKIQAALTVALSFVLIIVLLSSNDYTITSGIKALAIVLVIVIGILVTIVQLAISEIILLFLQIEINTRPQKSKSPSHIAKPQIIQPQQLETEDEWECNFCGHKQATNFIFCPKCLLNDDGLPRKV